MNQGEINAHNEAMKQSMKENLSEDNLEKASINMSEFLPIYQKFLEHVESFPNCKSCGKCCKSSIFISGIEASFLVGREWKNDGLGCPFLDDGKCSAYDVRPVVCRLFGPSREKSHSIALNKRMTIAHAGRCFKNKKDHPISPAITEEFLSFWNSLYAVSGVIALVQFKGMKNSPFIQGFPQYKDGKLVFEQVRKFTKEEMEKFHADVDKLNPLY